MEEQNNLFGHPSDQDGFYYSDYDFDYTPRDWGWDTEPLIRVPGFGFMPSSVNAELDGMTQDVGNMTDISVEHLDTIAANMYNEFKCTILNETWTFLYPHISVLPTEDICTPIWDQASCFPPSLANTTVSIPCMATYADQRFDTSYNATKFCDENGVWELFTNYSNCKELPMDSDYSDICFDPNMMLSGNMSGTQCKTAEDILDADISEIIYYVGYIISLIALVGACIIFFSFREMRLLRHKIHIGLFLTLILTDLAWIFTALIQTFMQRASQNPDDFELCISVWCNSQIFLRYFHLTTFFFMFLEGLYLFLQVQFPLSLATIKHIHFALFGWGCPAAIMTAWTWLKMTITRDNLQTKTGVANDSSLRSHDIFYNRVMMCPFIEEDDLDIYGYLLPMFILLAFNSIFLFWIMGIVLSKLHSQTAMDHDRRHLKAAKALVIIIPLTGFTYILMFIGPDKAEHPLGFTIFQSLRATFLSTTGFVITLPYCYCNSEVRRAISTRWRRWKMVRNVGYEQCRPRASVATNSIFLSQTQISEHGTSKLNLMTTRLDEKYLNVPVAVTTAASNNNSSSSI